MSNQNISEEERHEAATEEAATVGCPSLGIPKLPGGFDGTEPAKQVSDEARQKVEQAVVRQRQKLTQIADLALAAEAKSGNADVKLGSKYLENARALCTIRNIVGPGLAFTSDGKYYTPGWLADLAKEIAGRDNPLDPSAPEMKRKPSMDFGRFRVVRFAIPGMTLLSFRRKQEVDEEHGSLVLGRIIVAEIRKRDVGGEKLVNRFTVKSYEPGEAGRVLYAGDSWVSMSKTEKMVYRMVRTDIKETQRRHITRKRKAAAAKQQAHDNKVAAGEVK